MILAQPDIIPKIDKYAREQLGIPTRELMRRAGEAVANAVRSSVNKKKTVSVFAGKGNNGGDGYAAALLLKDEYCVCVYDVFGCGQRTEEGRYFLKEFIASGGTVKALEFDEQTIIQIRGSDCIVDAVFGTGFSGDYPCEAKKLAELFSSLESAVKIAVDVPLGVNAANGSVTDAAVYSADITVALGFVKPGLVSYPAKKYVGKLIYDNIGLQNKEILSTFTFDDYCIDYALASSLIPQRNDNSNKGSFGKLLLMSGSPEFRGAAYLSLEAALRSGVGLVSYLGEKELCDALISSFPEAIYKPFSFADTSKQNIDAVLELSGRHTAVLIGSGSSKSEGLRLVIEHLLATEGSPVVMDADAINVLADDPQRGRELIRAAKCKVVLTPHPLEFSRISGIPTDEIQENRLSFAKRFASDHNCILVLKGAATIVTDGRQTYINSSGSSALAKAGSGDVLAGMLASVIASGVDPISAAALSVYFHGLAADNLALRLSPLGVTPSDLPREIALQIAKAIQNNK